MKLFTLDRQWHTPNTTIGELFLPNMVKFCFTLEDVARAWGVKVKGHTAIPATTATFYKVEITFSQRFRKELPIIYTHIENGRYILRNGIEFEGIRAHGGTTHVNTEGCIITAFNFDGKDKVWDDASDELTKIIKDMLKTDTVGLRVRNLKNRLQ